MALSMPSSLAAVFIASISLTVFWMHGTLAQGVCPDDCACNADSSIANCNPATTSRPWKFNTTLPKPLSPTLKQLYMTGNDLTLLQADQLSSATGLNVLRLNNNRIKVLAIDTFSSLTALTELDLSNNNLRTLPLGIFANLGNLVTLRLDNNWITTLPVSLSDSAFNVFSNLTSMTELFLHGNSFHCDCTLAWLAPFINANLATVKQTASITCNQPTADSGVVINLFEQATPIPAFICSTPAIITGPSKSVVNTTTTIRLTCQTSGSPNPQVTWYHDNGTVAVDYYRLDVDESGSLVINNARHSDEGQYHCNVTSQEGHAASQTARLQVDEITCFDLRAGGNETDVDCGGPQCEPCTLTMKCLLDRDCLPHAVCLGSHQLASTLIYVSAEDNRYQTCAPIAEPGTTLADRLKASLRGRDAALPGVTGQEDMATLTQEIRRELATQLEVPQAHISNVRLEAEARHRRPLYKLRFSMTTGTESRTKTLLETQLHSSKLHGTLAYTRTDEAQIVL